jgi:hypothetical protein
MGGSRVALSFSVRWLCSPDATDPDPDLATQSPFLSPMSPESFGIHHDGFSIPSYISTYCPLAPGARRSLFPTRSIDTPCIGTESCSTSCTSFGWDELVRGRT